MILVGSEILVAIAKVGHLGVLLKWVPEDRKLPMESQPQKLYKIGETSVSVVLWFGGGLFLWTIILTFSFSPPEIKETCSSKARAQA